MGLVLLGADNLASDQADQNPSVFKRSKEKQWAPGKKGFEVIELGDKKVKVIFHNFDTWPADEWGRLATSLYSADIKVIDVDMGSCSMTEIGDNAFHNYGGEIYFSYAKDLTSVVLPPMVRTIGKNAFYVQSIVQHPDVVQMTLPRSLEYIDESAFHGFGINVESIPNKVTYLGRMAFSYSLVVLKSFRNNLAPMSAEVFSYCPNIQNIEFSGNTIGHYWFHHCDNLKKVWIRESCETILGNPGSAPFQFCPDDLVLYAEADAKPAGWSNRFNYLDYYGTKKATVVWGQKTRPF